MSRSEAAIKRGQTGFLKKRKRYLVTLGDCICYLGCVKKEAWQSARRALASSCDPSSRFHTLHVILSVDGVPFASDTIAAHHHAPKEL